VSPASSDQLDATERKTVFTAVRSGERLEDARLRQHAVTMAENMLRSSRRWDWLHRHRGWVLGFLTLIPVLGLVALLAGERSAGRVLNVVVGLLFLVVFLVLDPVFTRLRTNADLARQRNADGAAESAP
jgi:hypothetical protein